MLTALAGCGDEVDLAKVTYERTTVPATEGLEPSGGQEPTGTTGEPTGGDSLGADVLRATNPCDLLTDEVLGIVGTPEENLYQDFSTCANYMTDKSGNELNITLYLGETWAGDPAEADKEIAGLRGRVDPLDSGDACFNEVITDPSANWSIKVQTSGAAEDLCTPGTEVLTAVINLLRDSPPASGVEDGSLAGVDPCTVVDESVLTEAAGPGVTPTPNNVHWCNWDASGVHVGLWFRIGVDPAETTDSASGQVEQVDLGQGITGYQETDLDAGVSCRIEWVHRPLADNDFEVVTLTMDWYDSNDKAMCGKAQTVAKAVVGAV